MKKGLKISALLLALLIAFSFPILTKIAKATNEKEEVKQEENIENIKAASTGDKAIASGLAIGLAGLGGALGMGIAIGKAADGISRQPEADGKIRTSLMIGLVFVETVVIYALIVSILVIFVL